MSEGPDAGNMIAGIFLILFGLCITLVGGGCTLLLLSMSADLYRDGSWMLLLVSLVILGGGLTIIWVGYKLTTGGFNR